ncbi:MAG: hypothetical protein NWF01_07480 [Candidatus Bathyarchaeota archaeon]|nr:hypothetical protein [Candidatus Bathyarchaeota archaeon]
MEKTFGKMSEAITTSTATQITSENVETTGILGTKFTVFAIAFNIIGLAAVTFGNTAFSGNVAAADLVLGCSLACLTASMFRSSFSQIKQKLWKSK